MFATGIYSHILFKDSESLSVGEYSDSNVALLILAISVSKAIIQEDGSLDYNKINYNIIAEKLQSSDLSNIEAYLKNDSYITVESKSGNCIKIIKKDSYFLITYWKKYPGYCTDQVSFTLTVEQLRSII